MTASMLLLTALTVGAEPDLTPARERLGERIEASMKTDRPLIVTADPDGAIRQAEAAGVRWVRWTYWPDLYDASADLFNALPEATHVLKADPSGDEYVQFRDGDNVLRWVQSHKLDLAGGTVAAAKIKAAWGISPTPAPAIVRADALVLATADDHDDVEMTRIDGKMYKKHPDGRLEWCEECNGGPDPDPARTRALNRKAPSAPAGATGDVEVRSGATPKLTYAQAYRKAHGGGDGRKAKPLVIWVGGNFCERCVKESESEFVHYFTPSWPGMKAPSIVVSVWDETDFYITGKIDWWIEGDREFGHLATIRNSIRRWRDDRDRGLAGNAAHRAKFAAKAGLQRTQFVSAGYGDMGHGGTMMAGGYGGAQRLTVYSPDGRSHAGYVDVPMQSYRPPMPAMMSAPRMQFAPQMRGGMSAGVPLRGG